MSLNKPAIWTIARKWQGNLIPALLSLPFMLGGLFLFKPENPLDPVSLGLLIAFPIVGWLSLNAFGFWGNFQMRDQLGRIYGRDRGQKLDEMVFVGYARPSFRNALDPHEGVGFLILHPDHLEIYSDVEQWILPKTSITGFSLKANMHSWLLLGGWLVIEAGSQTIFVEPREFTSLRGNRKYRQRLKSILIAWHQA